MIRLHSTKINGDKEKEMNQETNKKLFDANSLNENKSSFV